MKDIIEYYYNLNITNLKIINNNYYFSNNIDDFYFVVFKRDEKILNELIAISNELNIKGIKCCEFVFNIQNEIITKIDNNNYLLIKCFNSNKEFYISDMLEINRKTTLYNYNKKYDNKWDVLWKNKIDYIEKQLQENNYNNIINNSIDYYIGLSEIAIYYINKTKEKFHMTIFDKVVLQHERIYYPNCKINYLNPCSFIFDLEIRDVAEYLKSMFFSGNDPIEELKYYLKENKLTNYSYNMLFGRLLFPTNYFDAYEQYINDMSENKLLNIINLNVEYEKFLKKAYNEISLYAQLLSIDIFKN